MLSNQNICVELPAVLNELAIIFAELPTTSSELPIASYFGDKEFGRAHGVLCAWALHGLERMAPGI